jgi:hypothetical protein
MRHVSPEALIDVAQGAAGPHERRHVQECAECRRQAEELRRDLGVLGEVDVPEPPAMYWEAFRRQVGRRVAGESRRRTWASWLVPVAAAAAIAVGLMVPRNGGGHERAAATLPAWSALPAGDEDAGLFVLQALADDGQLANAGACDEVAACVEALSDDDAASFTDALRGELQGRPL